VRDPVLRSRIVDECLVAYLFDSRDAWTLDADGRYRCAEAAPDGGHAAQAALMDRYRTPALRRERAA